MYIAKFGKFINAPIQSNFCPSRRFRRPSLKTPLEPLQNASSELRLDFNLGPRSQRQGSRSFVRFTRCALILRNPIGGIHPLFLHRHPGHPKTPMEPKHPTSHSSRLATLTLMSRVWRVYMDMRLEDITPCTSGKSILRGTECFTSLDTEPIPPSGSHETSIRSLERKSFCLLVATRAISFRGVLRPPTSLFF